MEIQGLIIRGFRQVDQEYVIDLWKKCGLVVPWNDPAMDISIKINFQPELFLVGQIGQRIVGTVMAGFEGHRGWINYLAVHPDFRRQQTQ